MNQQYNRPIARSPRRRKQKFDVTTRVLLIIFVVLGIILVFVGGRFVISLIKGWSSPTVADIPINPDGSADTSAFSVPGIPLQTKNGPASATWDGKSRINILLLGLDYSTRRQSTDQGSPLSDTMILVSIDPISRTIGAMSIRRDLWVTIPGYGEGKINSAYKMGEDYALPGGGAQLSMDTVEGLMGVPVDFYARVDFNAFETIIDEIGGVPIDIKQPMMLDWLGNGNKFEVQPGLQVLSGKYALAYARTRDAAYGDGDFARGSRQMEVITAIRNRVFNLSILPTLIARAPVIYNEISSGVQTNMSLDQAIQLAYLMAQIPGDNMRTYNVDTNVTTAMIAYDGSYILQIIPDQFRIMRDEMFSGSGGEVASVVVQQDNTNQANEVVMASGDPLPLAVQETAHIEILNASNTPGLADRTQSYLQSSGLTNMTIGNYDYQDSTWLIVHKSVPNTLTYLAAAFSVPNARISNQFDPNNANDITIILGNDWATTNPIP